MPARQHALSADFRRFYAQHFDFVWRTLRRFGIAGAGLDDAAQDVFVIVHRRFGVWGEDSQRAWLYTVARRVASAHRRSRTRHQRKLAALGPVARADTHSEEQLERRLGARAELARVGAAIDTLQAGRRQVYILIELEGFSAAEAARALDCNVNTVYSRLRRARKDMAATLAREPRTRERT